MSMKVAVTGNMGSGKTTVCKLFEQLGVPVFYADKEVKKLYDREHIRKAMTARFGSSIYDSSGLLRSDLLASHLFSDKDALTFVETLIHPLVHETYLLWHKQNNSFPYTVYEAAILFEKNRASDFEIIIYVAASEAVRLQRLLTRDKFTASQLSGRMQLQWPDEVKVSQSHFVIHNNDNLPLNEQVRFIHLRLLALAEE